MATSAHHICTCLQHEQAGQRGCSKLRHVECKWKDAEIPEKAHAPPAADGDNPGGA